jgi:hypothetical protein
MKATIPWAGALLSAALAAPLFSAEPYYSPVFHIPLRVAPDACGPGFYTVGPYGMVYGPNYWLRPAAEPFNGMLPPASNYGPHISTNPNVRSPRDFFMWRENMEDQMRRDLRPALVP